MADTFTVLFVCMGNICRSPTAHGVFRQAVQRAGLAERVLVASAATHDLHPGEPPDPRSVKHAKGRGYDLSDLRASTLTAEELERADLVVVMDDNNLAVVQARCPSEHQHKVMRMAGFCRRHPAVAAVPDPYYGGPEGFEQVLDLVEDACEGLLVFVRERVDKAPG
ncbi:low molecular weight protein-tyrosine-phosphatase [Variovorax rhizosphaerae]|uniref:Low molecular weight protein-tyrosine-phosphatase n=1 Tax=Variovorax rhizosphaerae TaxID=1836200 RepID=A0ABU8WDL8_9BURK